MFATNYLTAILLSLTILLAFQTCDKNSNGNSANHENAAKADGKMISGSFSAKTPKGNNFIKLEIKPDGGARLLFLVALHSPPVDVENLTTKLDRMQDGALCFAERPKTVERCLVSVDESAVVVKLKPGGELLKLKKIPE